MKKFEGDPVEHRLDGWWFWDETWTEDTGPFETEKEAREALDAYAEHLYGIEEGDMR